MADKGRNWEKTGTVAGCAEWLRKKSGAFAVVVVRRDDAVMAVDPDLAPIEARRLIEERLPDLAADVEAARKAKRPAARLELGELRE
jgi:hypothetical protein